LAQLPKTEGRDTLQRFGVEAGAYATLTLHRPSNVDVPEVLRGIVEVMIELSRELPLIWPIHPRSSKMLARSGVLHRIESNPGVKLVDPLGYLDMLTLNRRARMILTDSGGLQEEATVLGVPCVTLRHNTERPVTVVVGGNRLAGNQPEGIRAAIQSVMNDNSHDIRIPELWDGKAAVRIADVLMHLYA
jgi:UDP-N-acetylglucosamine 2-epimerase (non-hydrolysing)